MASYSVAVLDPGTLVAIDATRRFLARKGLLPSNWTPERIFDGITPARLDEPRQLLCWQPDCRATVLAFEALSGLSFEARENGAELSVNPPIAAKASFVLARMTRPDMAILRHQAERVIERQCERLMPKSDDIEARDRLCEVTAEVVPALAFWCAALPIHPDRMPRTIELINLTLTLASFAEQRFKHALSVARPNQVNPAVFPSILTPAHASLPSGHATECFAVAHVLASLLAPPTGDSEPGSAATAPSIKSTLLAIAARIADNRQVAGLHYPIDTLAGRLLGTVLAQFLVSRCRPGACSQGIFDGAKLSLKDGLLWYGSQAVDEPDEAGAGLEANPRSGVATLVAGGEVKASDALAFLWNQARREFGIESQPAG